MNPVKQYLLPRDRSYDRHHHMWAKASPDGKGIIVGIDEFGLDAMGDLAYLTLARQGARVGRGQPLGTMEAAKMTGDIVSPITGVVAAVNDPVLRNPARVNADPYGEGWLIEIVPTAWDNEKGVLLSGQAIDSWLADEEQRAGSQGWKKV